MEGDHALYFIQIDQNYEIFFCKCIVIFFNRMENLTEIALINCEVSGPGPENEIRKHTPSVLFEDQ